MRTKNRPLAEIRAQHTPTPWCISDEIRQHIEGPRKAKQLISENWVCNLDSISDDDAAFIVAACNAHEGLVKALEQCLTSDGAMGYIQPKKYAHVRFEEINRIARAALADAEEP